MSEVSFYLKEPSSKEETIIFLYLFHGAKKPIKWSTGLKIKPSCWNFDKMIVRDKRDAGLSEQINRKLEDFTKQAKEMYIKISSLDIEARPERFRYLMNQQNGKIKHVDTMTFFDYFQSKIDRNPNLKKSSKGENLIKILKSYQKAKKIVLDFNTMNGDFAEDFRFYLMNFEIDKHGSKYRQNSISNYLSMVRTLLKDAFNSGINKYNYFNDRKFISNRERIVKEPLTLEEIDAIFRVNLPKKNKLQDRARDIFIIGVCTLFRFSDYSKLKPENINGNYVFKMTQKTSKPILIPVHPYIREILSKYNGRFPGTVTKRNLNHAIKLVAKQAGIDSNIVLSYTEGGQRVEKIVPKWETVSSHSARKSGATILRKQGVPIEDIQHLLGHSSIETTMRYLYVDLEETARRVENIPFFKPQKQE